MPTQSQTKALLLKGLSPEERDYRTWLDALFAKRHPLAHAKLELKRARQAQLPDQRGFLIGDIRL